MVSESVSQEPLIRLEKLNKSFSLNGGDRFDAVRDVSLTVARGDALGLIGRSGAGKSTLLRLMNLLERPDSGRVFVARQKIGMIFQQFNLLQNATVSDNIAFPLRIHGRHDRAAIAARVRECAEVVGLVDKLDHYPAQLSGGQKQRVAIARALAPEPSVLLCDEPTSALDTETTRSVLATLKEINQRLGVTIVIVTHELSVVLALCRQAAVVEQGLLVEKLDLDGSAPLAPVSALGRELVQHLQSGHGSMAAQGAAGHAQGSLNTTGGAQAPQA